MNVIRTPDPVQRRQIESRSHTTSFMCWTCGSCDFECPVNIATGRLRPQKLVRLATLGLLEELLAQPEIWYCLTCRRCLQICPNDVKPVILIEYLRQEAVRQHLVPVEMLKRYTDLFSRFQRVRWHAASACLQAETVEFSDRTWRKWIETPVSETHGVIQGKRDSGPTGELTSTAVSSQTAACFTCGECSSACPVACGRRVFDPRVIFHSQNLGLLRDLFVSPTIWLCISCGRCTDACSQMVDGRSVIAALQKAALDSGAVGRGFTQRLEETEKFIFPRFLNEVDALFGFNRPVSADIGAGKIPAAAYV